MAFDWSKTSTSRFTQDVLFYLVIAAVVLGGLFLLPHLKRAIQRLGTVPMFSIFTWRGAGFLSVPVAGLALLTLSAYSIKITEHPKFCTVCHYMGDYYESWQHSSHRDVACVDCHYEPGLSAELQGKVNGLLQLAKYVSHSYGTKPHALISNRSCMRVGCHDQMDHSKQTLLFRGTVKFRHEKHLRGHPRGKELNCVSCHGQIVEGQHLGVAETTCLTCHFYGRHDNPVAIGDCETCHDAPAEPVTFMGQPFRHRAFLTEKTTVRCVDCHSHITEGDGRVSRTRCQSCHLRQTAEVTDQAQFHLVHVSAGHVDCLQCHDEIKHGGVPMTEQLLTSAQCSECHSAGSHGIQDRIYAGTAVPEIEAVPDVMFTAGVACTGCHVDVRAVTVGGTTVTTRVSGSKQCTECHHNDRDYGEMLTEWQADTKARLAAIEPQVTRLETLARSADLPAERLDRATKLLSAARVNVSHVVHDGSFGAHNYGYVAAVLDHVEVQLRTVSGLLSEGRP
jgi:nitrate/TMAO reductase-like tetraheme cytochrome c subunit